MKIRFLRAVFLAAVALIFANSAVYAGLPEATAAFKRLYQTPASAQFEETPFNGIYSVRQGESSINLFDEVLTLDGYGLNWEMRENLKTTDFRKLVPGEAQAMWQVLRSNLKKDWMILSPYSQGEKSTVVISAPNCPVCKDLEQDLKRHGQAIGGSVHIVPMLLGKESDGFVNAVMCSNNPNLVWTESWGMKGRYPSSNTECQKSRWVELVQYHTFQRQGNQIQVRTPAIIRPDGTLHFGWKGGSSLSETKDRLGLK